MIRLVYLLALCGTVFSLEINDPALLNKLDFIQRTLGAEKADEIKKLLEDQLKTTSGDNYTIL